MVDGVVQAILLDGTVSPIDSGRLVPWDGPSTGDTPTRLYGDDRGRWFLATPDGRCREIKARTAAIQLLTWGFHLPSRLARAMEAGDEPEPRARPEPLIESAGPEGCVILRGAADPPIVLGEPVPPLTIPQYDVVKVLCDAGGKPVRLPDLITKSRHSDARKILGRTMKGHVHWPKVIHTPGKPRRGYRIAPPVAYSGATPTHPHIAAPPRVLPSDMFV